MKEMKIKGYKVPEGYFEDLKSQIMTTSRSVEVQSDGGSKPTIRVQMRSAAVFAASFAAMVVMAVTGYYFTGYKAAEREMAQNMDEMAMLYGVDEYDLMEFNMPLIDSTILAESSVDYFEAYGFPDYVEE